MVHAAATGGLKTSDSRPDDPGSVAPQPVDSHSSSTRAISFIFAVVLSIALLVALFGAVQPTVANNDAQADGPVEGTVEIDVTTPENEFDAGEEDTLQLVISNDGEVTTEGTHPQEVRDRATEARSADVSITDVGGAPIEVRTGKQTVGTIDSGDSIAETFDIFVESGAEPGEYDLEVTVAYRDVTVTEYEEGISEEVEIEEETEAEETTVDVTVEIADEARFTIESMDHDVHVGETGELDLEIENTGTVDVEAVVVTAETTDQDVFFGSGGASSERAIETWEADETRALTYAVGTTDEALTEPYPIDLTFEYTDPDGDSFTQTESFNVTPLASQDYTIVAVDHGVTVGDDGLATVELRNDGPQHLTNATVTIDTNDAAITIEDADGGSTAGETYVGNWSAGETIDVTMRIGAAADASPRSYALDATVAARNEAGDPLSDRTREFGIKPYPKQSYSVVNVSHDVVIGDAGVLTVEMRNDGPLNLTEAAVQVSSNDAAIAFGSGGVGDTVEFDGMAFEAADGGSPTSEAFVGDWAANETKTLVYRAGATEDALERNYTIDLSIDASDEADHDIDTRTRSFGLQPAAEQTFAIDGVDTDLRVGEDGNLVASVTNSGDLTAANVVIRYVSEVDQIFAREGQYAIGTLEPGESRDFDFRFEIGEEAEPGPRLLEFETRYRNHRGEVRLSEAEDLIVDVHDRRSAFTATAINATFEAGDSDLLEVELENQRDERVENVRAKIFADSPLGSGDDEAFVDALEPGESATLLFELDVSSGANPKDYPLSLDVRYEDEREQTQLSRTYRIPVTVTESASNGIPVGAIGLAGLVIGGAVLVFRTKLADVGNRVSEHRLK